MTKTSFLKKYGNIKLDFRDVNFGKDLSVSFKTDKWCTYDFSVEIVLPKDYKGSFLWSSEI